VKTPLFLALTRPASFAGLPLSYVVALSMTTIGGFIALGSFIWLTVSAVVGYGALRAVAAYDPHLFDVFLTSLQRTPPPPRWFAGKGISYGA
jgi:type IV secretion system protein VirB3